MLSEDEFVEICEGLSNKVREVFHDQKFPIIMAVLGKVAGEMVYEMQETPSNEGSAEIIARLLCSVKLSYDMTKEAEETLPEGGTTH